MVQWLRICLPMQGDTGSIPGPGRFHNLRQLSLLATTTEAPALSSPCSATREASTAKSTATIKSLHPAMKTQYRQKKNKKTQHPGLHASFCFDTNSLGPPISMNPIRSSDKSFRVSWIVLGLGFFFLIS